MTAVLGAWVARKKRIPLYLDIRDIFVDTIKDVLPKHFAILAKPVFSLLESWAINSAAKVNLVSQGFSDYFSTRYPSQQFSYFSNGIDDEFLSESITESVPRTGGVVEVLYAGNLGEGQGLHAIIPDLAKKMQGRVHFKIIGDGGRKNALLAALVSAGVDNVELLPPMKRAQLIKAYLSADVLFLHLNDHDAFLKVLPSKLFEYGAMAKPIWQGSPATQLISCEQNWIIPQSFNHVMRLRQNGYSVNSNCEISPVIDSLPNSPGSVLRTKWRLMFWAELVEFQICMNSR